MALLAGGALPASVRGHVLSEGLVHIADWYATFGRLAGYDGTRDAAAAAASLPPVRLRRLVVMGVVRLFGCCCCPSRRRRRFVS